MEGKTCNGMDWVTCKCRVAEVVKHECMACSQLPHELPTNIMPKQKLDGPNIGHFWLNLITRKSQRNNWGLYGLEIRGLSVLIWMSTIEKRAVYIVIVSSFKAIF